MALTTTPEQCDKRGQDLLLYYNVGTLGSPIWVEHLGIVGDLTLNEAEELNTRSVRSTTREVNEYTEGEIELSIGGTQITDTNYDGYAVLQSMRRGGDPVDIMVLTGSIDTVGSQGWRGKMRNSDRGISGPESGAMTTNFNLQPAACTDTPVGPVQINVAGTVSDFDPASYTAVST